MKPLERVARAVCREFGGRWQDVLKPTRGRPDDAWRRALAIWVWQRKTGSTLTLTGVAFDRDRSTVRHAIRRVEDRFNAQTEAGAVLRSSLRGILDNMRA